MFSTQSVTDFLNVCLDELLAFARQMGTGWSIATSYANAADGTIYYNLPTGFVKMQSVTISGNGSNLSTAAPADSKIVVLEENHLQDAIDAYDRQQITAPTYYALTSTQYGIFAPPAAAHVGTNSIKLVAEVDETALSANGDEPVIPNAHHDLLCLKTAKRLLGSKNLPFPKELNEELTFAFDLYRAVVSDRAANYDMQIPVERSNATLRRQTRAGMVRRT